MWSVLVLPMHNNEEKTYINCRLMFWLQVERNLWETALQAHHYGSVKTYGLYLTYIHVNSATRDQPASAPPDQRFCYTPDWILGTVKGEGSYQNCTNTKADQGIHYPHIWWALKAWKGSFGFVFMSCWNIRGSDTHGEFSAIFIRETNFVVSCLLLCIRSGFWKGSTLKGKNLLPLGANSFLLE